VGRTIEAYMLINEDLLQYEGPNGTRAVCHLLMYGGGRGRFVSVVGNFDGHLGASTTNAIELVATAVAARLGREDFQLIEWYPHDGGQPFSDVVVRTAGFAGRFGRRANLVILGRKSDDYV
jgi:hypothetical protein